MTLKLDRKRQHQTLQLQPHHEQPHLLRLHHLESRRLPHRRQLQPQTDTAAHSTSKRKLETFWSHVGDGDHIRSSGGYRIIDIDILKTLITAAYPSCPTQECSGKDDNIVLSESTVYGLSSKLELHCMLCEQNIYSGFTSQRVHMGQSFDINNRFTFATKADGLGYEQASSFLAHLNLPPPITDSSFNERLSSLFQACEAALREHLALIHEIVRKRYIEEDLASEDDDVLNISVSFDGTWHKRGHISHNGIGVAIDVLIGYVVDFEVLFNFCLICEREKTKGDNRSLKNLREFAERHRGRCDKNHDGSSNSMEVAAAKKILERSVHGKLHYVTMLSDGDSKAYDSICLLRPYGDKQIKKECVNHVAKHLTANLKSLKTKSLKSGVSLGGRGMITEPLIKILHSYYRDAIVKNAQHGVDAICKAVMAAPYHITSTDDDPDHRYCPDNSWCWFKNPEKPKSKPLLPKWAHDHILPVYEKLADRELLGRCSRVSTQNSNESVNNVIWRRCPKTEWYGKSSVNIAATMGVVVFNSGLKELARIEQQFGLTPGLSPVNKAERKDTQRKNRQVVASGQRRDRIHRRVQERQVQIQKEGVTYAAGRFGV